jgi:hypothetical protein
LCSIKKASPIKKKDKASDHDDSDRDDDDDRDDNDHDDGDVAAATAAAPSPRRSLLKELVWNSANSDTVAQITSGGLRRASRVELPDDGDAIVCRFRRLFRAEMAAICADVYQ